MSDRPQFDGRIETMSADETASMQAALLQRQMHYVGQRSAFYAKRFAGAGIAPADIRSPADLAHLPFTEKSDLRASQAEVPPLGSHVCADPGQIIRVHASSGTTGTPSFVGITRRDRDRWTELVARAYRCQGLRPGDRFAMGLAIGFFVGGLPVAAAVEEVGATLLPIGTGASDRLVTSIRVLRANVLATTPSYALYLAEQCHKSLGVDPKSLGLERLLVGAEPGGGIPEVRAAIQDAWQAKCLESIGNADVITIHSAECDAQDGCHFLMPDYLLMEVIDPETGTPQDMTQPEVQGEMVFTHLDRDCHPLVRFRTRDHVVVKTGRCSCGRTTPRLRCIGRTDDLLIVRGVNVWPSAIKDVVAGFRPEVSGEMQIRIPGPGPMVDPPLPVVVERGEGALPEGDADLAARIEAKLRATLIFTARVQVVPAGSLPRTEAKAKLVHREGTA